MALQVICVGRVSLNGWFTLSFSFQSTSNLPSHCDRQVNDMLAIHHLFVCYYQHWNLDTLPETNIAPEN